MIKSKKITKSQINNRGYNKYLQLEGEINATINQEKIEEDVSWDGLKGYTTNSNLSSEKIISHYQQLWQIEKAFRISKTDLRIRPIFHRKKSRIEAHISIAFIAYTVYKELERILKKYNSDISAEKAINLTKTIYNLNFTLPQSNKIMNKIINLNDDQKSLIKIFADG